jgi:cyanate permease
VIATTIATTALPIGAAAGFVIPAFFVDDEDLKPENRETAKGHIFHSLLFQAILGAVLSLLIFVFFREKPPTPPSPSAGAGGTQMNSIYLKNSSATQINDNTETTATFWPSIKYLLTNKGAILLMLIFGFIQGVFNTLGTVVGQIGNRFGYSTDDASTFGAVFIIGGLVGSAIFGIWVELKKKYKLSVIVISVLSFLSMIATAFSFYSKESWLVTITCFVVGASMIPIMAVGFELGVEVTYPIDESYSTGLLMFAG